MFCYLHRNNILRRFISTLHTARPIELVDGTKSARINLIHKKGFKNFGHEDEKLNPWEYGYPLLIFVLVLPLFSYRKLFEAFDGNRIRLDDEDAYNENIVHVYLDEKELPPETKFFDGLALTVLEIFGRNDYYKIKDQTADE